ncbi:MULTISPECIES: heavy metal sensor histidine kinase [Pseudomonas syringae group]|nr:MULTISPECIES: heavy metal sensor histidine kinase [Pseudomonas syringae group]EKN45758.1 heavy metal sensor kinase [Pseudomonas viridiflava UASWS0038]KPL62655.1 histidine kinase [Pseudomonas viridiflava]KPZ18136.1 Signal transduction histidine kinase [Pseudomonas viridiflava]MDY0917182.1 heavy metal sensor histidine kinase [Pseudomonas viridiflava]OAG84453.1 histidine kinase [Pseudomonas viridiflava]
MQRRRQPSLTLRSTLAFALVAMLTVGGAGLYLYQSIEQTVMQRSDHAVLARLDHFRKLLRYDLTMDNLKGSPQLFENMLDSEEDIFIIGEPGKTPVISVNPQRAPLPELPTVAQDQALRVEDLRSGLSLQGVPLRAAAVQVMSNGVEVRLQAAHLMVKEMAMLATFRERIYAAMALAFLVTALLGYLLLRRGLRPLRRMAAHAAAITPASLHSRLDSQDTPVELQQLSDAFNAMLDRLDDGYRRLTQFSADLAHEIRTPVGSLMGHCQVALRQNRSADDYQALLASNLEELERISRLVESILFLARADEAQSALERKSLDLNEELHRVAGYFEGLAEERNMTLVPSGQGTVQADPILLRRALSNLVANAIRYADENSEVLMRVAALDGEWKIDVENQGPQLPQASLSRLFDRFYRGDASRHQRSDSNGLGLAIVAAIMHLHGGRVEVAQPAAGRICFSLIFPAT